MASLNHEGLYLFSRYRLLGGHPLFSGISNDMMISTRFADLLQNKNDPRNTSRYGNGVEQWNEYRRTGYPVLEEHQLSSTNSYLMGESKTPFTA